MKTIEQFGFCILFLSLVGCCLLTFVDSIGCKFPSSKARFSHGLFAQCGNCAGESKVCQCTAGFVAEYGEKQLGSEFTCAGCPAGKYASETSGLCEVCPAQTFSTDLSSNCTACPPDSFSEPGSSACSCRDGYVRSNENSKNGLFECYPCHSGTYADLRTQKCTTCPKNTFSTALSTACLPCPAGATSPPGANQCICGGNTFPVGQNSPVSMSCIPCPPGTTIDSSTGSNTCTCPGGTRQLGFGEKTKCYRCPAGKYAKAGDTICGSKCLGNSYNAPDMMVVNEAPLSGIFCTVEMLDW